MQSPVDLSRPGPGSPTVMKIKQVIDDALEIAVVPSFTRLGYSVRRHLFEWMPPPSGSLRGRTVLITGPTSGLGRAATDALADLGARLILVGRSEQRLIALRDELVRAHGEDRFRTHVADMASLSSVWAVASRIGETEPRLDVVIDNAGAIFPERTTSPDGFESTFATMVLGPFALVVGLLPLLRRTGGARVVAVTSGGMYAQSLDLDDLEWKRRPFDGARAYAHAKRAQVSLVREWARRIPADEVSFAAMHPGWADTPGISAALPRFYGLMGPLLRTPAEGADTTVWLAADPAAAGRAVTGRLFLDRRPRPFDRVPRTRVSAADRRRLWDVVVGLAGVTDPAPADPTTRPRSSDMTRIHERIETALPIDAAFDYIADFANSQDWDPGTASSHRLHDGPVGPGSRYALEVRMGGRIAPMEYRITEYDRPRPGRARRLRARASTPSTTSASSAVGDRTVDRLHGRHPPRRAAAVRPAVPRRGLRRIGRERRPA